jgi:hypothetical protein
VTFTPGIAGVSVARREERKARAASVTGDRVFASAVADESEREPIVSRRSKFVPCEREDPTADALALVRVSGSEPGLSPNHAVSNP